MLIETDLLFAYLKATDWLKPVASEIMKQIERGQLSPVQASATVLHELFYVQIEYLSLDVTIGNSAKIMALSNLELLAATAETYVSSMALMKTYAISSIFDAIHAATALGASAKDNKIISTDTVFDRIPGLERIDPKDLIS